MKGLPFVYPDNELSYSENFLSMVARMSEPRYRSNPVFTRAIEVLFILHADHEQNCSTNAVRGVGSSHVDPYSALAAGIAALYGPLHGGANEAVLRMIEEIGDKSHVPAFIDGVKKGSGRLMGFGHRVYKSYDPRAKIVKQLANRGLRVGGRGQGSRDRARARAYRAAGRLLRLAQALPQCRLLHGADLSGDEVSRRRSSPCCSPSRARRVGWRSGKRCCSTRSRRSRDRGRSTSARGSDPTRAISGRSLSRRGGCKGENGTTGAARRGRHRRALAADQCGPPGRGDACVALACITTDARRATHASPLPAHPRAINRR